MSKINLKFGQYFLEKKIYILNMNKYIDAYNSMGNSGFEIIDFVFKVCVIILVDLGNLVGLSYEAINIFIFVFLQPGLILLFFILWIKERRKNKVVWKGRSVARHKIRK